MTRTTVIGVHEHSRSITNTVGSRMNRHRMGGTWAMHLTADLPVLMDGVRMLHMAGGNERTAGGVGRGGVGCGAIVIRTSRRDFRTASTLVR